MKITYFIGSIIVLMIAAFGISKVFFSLRADDIQEIVVINKTAITEKKISVRINKTDGVTIAPVYVTNPNKTGDEFAAQEAIESANYDKTSPKDSAKALIESGTKEGVLSVLKAIIDAHVQQDYDLKDSLMQILADVNSIEAADMLTDVLTRKVSISSDLLEIPEDITYAIKNAIRLIPNEVVGEVLAQKYHNADSEEEKNKLFDIKHSVMIARLVADALAQGDNGTADRLMGELTGIEDNLAIKGMMILAREKSLPLDNVAKMLSLWNFTKPDKPQAHFALVEYLGNAEFSPAERSLAANAMAGEKDKEMAISALKKAQLFEENQFVKEYIEDALSRITE